MVMPFQVIGFWFRGLFSILLMVAAGYLFWLFSHEQGREVVSVPSTRTIDVREEEGDRDAPAANDNWRTEAVVPWSFGFNRGTYYLLGGIGLLLAALGGRWVASPRLLRRSGATDPIPTVESRSEYLQLSDGSKVHYQINGAVDGPTVILTHGWGLDSDEWCYARQELGNDFRVITWDLPGLGRSDRPADRNWSLNRLAQILDELISATGGGPVVLMGHSIGGMITLTYCQQYPQALGSRVSALIIGQSTYTNPVETTSMAALYRPLQGPVLKPLCYAMIALSPLCRVLNGLSWLNGSAARSTERSSFSGDETREQLDFLTQSYVVAAPDVVGHGMLAMMDYDATSALPKIDIPVLVVTGDSDKTCLPEASAFMVANLPQGTLSVLPNARHCGLFEHHATFHEIVRGFVKRVSPVRDLAATT